MLKFLFSPAGYGKPGDGLYLQGPALFVFPTLIAVTILFIASLVWLCQDARKRNRNAFIALLFILLTGWPASFIWWFWLRPPLKDTI
jgi:hypothetical protein